MRRIALISSALLGLVAWVLVAFAGADDSHTYEIQMYNAFGIVNGSEVRVGGVTAGTVTDLNVDAQKRAVVTVNLNGPLAVLGKDTTCASQPQSLIAEYFIDCSPKGPPLPEGGEIKANHVQLTVQPDLVADSLRQSYRDRLSMLINEFGTALAGNAANLNQAIRLGSPALMQLRKVLHILAQQNATIRDLNVNSDKIFSELAANKANVVRFIQRAGDAAAASAARRDDLSADFDRLDNFLAQLGPTSAQLAQTARQSTPLLADLNAAAPQLNRLAVTLPAFNDATKVSLVSLGKAALPGRQALRQGRDELQALSAASRNSQPVADALAKFLLDIGSPKRAVGIDDRAAKSCSNKTKSCYSTGRPAPTGYTGMEGLLNYAYYQAGALNSYDAVGHLLHFTLYDVMSGPCGNFSTGHDATTGKPGVPAKGGGLTTDITKTAPCVSWLGPNQPGISQQLHLPPYDKSVCSAGLSPDNAATRAICDPSSKVKTPKRTAAPSGGASAPATKNRKPAGSTGPSGTTTNPSTTTTPSTPTVPPTGGLPDAGGTLRHLRDLLGLGAGGGGALGGVGNGANQALGGGSGSGAANDLLNFMFSN